MTPEQFTYWLQGHLELREQKLLSERQIQIIEDHLKMVFDKKTPDRDKKDWYGESWVSGYTGKSGFTGYSAFSGYCGKSSTGHSGYSC